jgi:hypothetical protein
LVAGALLDGVLAHFRIWHAKEGHGGDALGVDVNANNGAFASKLNRRW